nr:hypothetical protein [Rhizobium laguerreae]
MIATPILQQHFWTVCPHRCEIVETGNESWRFKNRSQSSHDDFAVKINHCSIACLLRFRIEPMV